MIVVVDAELGNIGSVLNMLKKIGAEAQRSSHFQDILSADSIILPGVGAFDHGMRQLARLGLIDVLNEAALVRKIPVLGICLGMQLFTRCSEEGQLAGLGWIDADTVRFRFDVDNSHLKIPHMGWNEVTPTRRDTLFQNLDSEAGFYFVHSYHVVCDSPKNVLAISQHGYEFVASIQNENIFGTQFHPEKSHRYGKQLLTDFVSFVQC